MPHCHGRMWNCTRIRLVGMLVLGMFVNTGLWGSHRDLLAEERQPEVTQPSAAGSPRDEAPSESAESGQAGETNRQRTVTIGFYLLLLIVLTGVSMVLLVLLGGSVVRRTARAQRPVQCPSQDPLWFTRGKSAMQDPSAKSSHPSDPQHDRPSSPVRGDETNGDERPQS